MELKNDVAEQTMIGAVLVKPQLWARAAEHIRADHFADALHSRIWQRIGERVMNNQPVSPMAIGADLAADTTELEGGLPLYLTRCATSVVTFDLRAHVEILRDLAGKRQLFNLAMEIEEALREGDEDYQKIADTTHRTLAEILEHDESGKLRTERAVLQEFIDGIEKPRETFRTGYGCLDACMVGGMHAGRAYAIAARRKAGKTLLLGAIAYNLARNGVPHLFICSEASSSDIIQRNYARALGVNDQDFKDPRLAENAKLVGGLVGAVPRASTSAYYVDLYDPRFADLQSTVLQAIVTKKPRVIIHDYLQLTGGREKNMGQVEHLDRVAQWWANVARKHHVATLVAAQINQEGNVRFGEGMTLAFDQVYRLERAKGDEEGTYGPEAWMELVVSRYTSGKTGCGTKNAPAFRLSTAAGPWFEEIVYDEYAPF